MTIPTDGDHNGALVCDDPDKVKHLFSRLRLLGATSVLVAFSGSGDSGQVDDVTVYNAESQHIEIEREQIEWTTEQQIMDTKHNIWRKKQVRKQVTLTEAITDMFYDADAKLGHDWANNDGGNGEMTIDFAESPPSIDVIYHIAHTEYETSSYNFSGIDHGE